MFKLIIFCVYDPWANMSHSEVELDEDYTQSQAELRALRWLSYRPNDIAMLVADVEVCAHCDEEIFLDPEGVLHKWRHAGRGSYLCWSNSHTQATPKEYS